MPKDKFKKNHISIKPIIDRQKEHGQDTVEDELNEENSLTDLQTEPTSHRKMHLVPKHRQEQCETLLDFIDYFIEKILGSEE